MPTQYSNLATLQPCNAILLFSYLHIYLYHEPMTTLQSLPEVLNRQPGQVLFRVFFLFQHCRVYPTA